jgi:hypothetical protein
LGVFCFAVLGLLFALHVTTDAAANVQKEKRIRGQMENRLARLSIPPFQESSTKISEDGVDYTEEVQREQVRTKDVALLPGYWKIRVLAEWSEGRERQSWDTSHLIWRP